MERLPLREFRRLDLNSAEQGVPVSKLMANAGKALAEEARRMAKGHDGPVVVLCGKGNNGGDGFAAAGVLHRWGVPVVVVLLPPRAQITGVARQYLDLLPPELVQAWPKGRKPWQPALVVDCLLGSGIQGRPRAPYDAAIRWINKQARILACDVPSGFGSPLAVKPQLTVTFHAAKEGMDERCGEVKVVEIGIPKDAGQVGLGDLDAGFIRPGRDSHKGSNGRVLIIGGGPFTGAPHYAGMGAARSGADLVHVATTASAASVIATWGPTLLVHAVDASGSLGTASLPGLRPILDRVDAVVLGPGMGDAPDGAELVAEILKAGLPTVIDADALGMLPDKLPPSVVLTPHGAEFRRLAGKAPTRKNVEAEAARRGCTILRKGAVDIISDGTRTRECHRGHPAMTVGGTGDVLAGAVGALLAKGAEAFDAACAAAYLVGCAGEVAASIRSYGAGAADVHEAIPAVLLRLE